MENIKAKFNGLSKGNKVLVTLVMSLMLMGLVAAGIYGYMLWSTPVSFDVNEPISVQSVNMEYGTVYPGNFLNTTLLISNTGNEDYLITIDMINQTGEGITNFLPMNFTILSGEMDMPINVNFTISKSAPPTNFSSVIEISRQ
jgi:hypothetical protein